MLTDSNNRRLNAATDESVEQLAEKAAEASGVKQNGIANWVTREWIAAFISLIFLIIGLLLDHFSATWFSDWIRFGWYALAFSPVAFPVIKQGVVLAGRGEVFTEFSLMTIATLGAFYLGEYPEGVAVMLFYSVGELLQGAAVSRAKRNIKALLDVRPEVANLVKDGKIFPVRPEQVQVGEIIQVKVGERVPLDGEIISGDSSFNTAALTGESMPAFFSSGDTVLAGMINEGKVIDLSVTKLFGDSSLSRILTLVQNAQGRKAKTELLIRRFARIYTPAVVFLALAVVLVPWFVLTEFDFNLWLYRALIFLVISCPCALVVAIPLGYFGGIGAGSRNGILFKGSSYLDKMTRLGAVVFDKTGTLTKGTFSVREVVDGEVPSAHWLPLISALERYSSHPIAKAISTHFPGDGLIANDVVEFRGLGLRGNVNGETVIAGNHALFKKLDLPFGTESATTDDTTILVSISGKFAGYIVINDEIRSDAASTIKSLHNLGIETAMLSGDKNIITKRVASLLKIPSSFGELLPEQKVEKLESIRKQLNVPVAFVGDGINDSPVIAVSDIGIAMGGMGSDAAIETSDVVIQTDQLSKIVTAIKIGKATDSVIWQNIGIAFLVKILVMALGTIGVASMWEAVFADVGVALLAIGNAIRIQYMKFS